MRMGFIETGAVNLKKSNCLRQFCSSWVQGKLSRKEKIPREMQERRGNFPKPGFIA